MKLVSVIILYFNSEKFIRETIESVTRQTHDLHEIIIVDDGSSPESRSKLDTVFAQLPASEKVRIVTNDTNLGFAKARNVGIAASKGEYIIFLDADDMLLGRYSLEYRADFLDTNESFDGVGGYSQYITADSRIELQQKKLLSTKYFRESVAKPTSLLENFCNYALETSSTCIMGLFLLSGGCLVRKTAFNNCLFNTDFDREDDIEWTVRFLHGGGRFSLQKIAFHLRRSHPGQHHHATPKHVYDHVREYLGMVLEQIKIKKIHTAS